jgi:hypothetical protein
MTGQCHCGQIQYETTGAVVKCSTCDCRGCQRATGTLAAPFVTVKRADFRVTAGEPASFRPASGDMCDQHGVWHFCRDCGTPLYWLGHHGDEIDLFAGSLDDISVFQARA